MIDEFLPRSGSGGPAYSAGSGRAICFAGGRAKWKGFRRRGPEKIEHRGVVLDPQTRLVTVEGNVAPDCRQLPAT